MNPVTIFREMGIIYGGQLLNKYSHTKFSRYSIPITVYSKSGTEYGVQYIDYNLALLSDALARGF